MLVLKCSLCGYEQVIKKRLDKDIYDELTNNKGLFCGRKVCESYNSIQVPKGLIRESFVLGDWSVLKIMTTEEYKGIKRAQEILEIGLSQLRKEVKLD